jgi:hypothetical protein
MARPALDELNTDDLGRGLWPLFKRHLTKILAGFVAAGGITGITVTAGIASKALAAVELVQEHEARLAVVEMNGYLTCLMVKQVAAEKLAEVKLVLAVDLDCAKPSRKEPVK